MKIIPLETSFKYESNNIIFIIYLIFYKKKLIVKVYLKLCACLVNKTGGSSTNAG
jgi:hypothetical protein